MPIPYNPYDFIDGTNPNTKTGRFEYAQASLKQLINSSIAGEAGSPFEVIIGGERSFQNNDNTLKLNDRDFGGTSGYVSIKMKSGFQSLWFLATENNDFFDDNALDGIRSDWTSENELIDVLEGEFPTVWYQADTDGGLSRTIFGLDEGDYVSIDIDSESGKVAQMRVRLGGVDYYNNKEIDDETYLSKLWVRKWNPDYVRKGDPEDFSPQPEDEPFEPDYEPITCPVGFIDNGYGICIPDVPPEPEPEPEIDPAEEVSGGAVVLLVGAIIGVVVLAVRL